MIIKSLNYPPRNTVTLPTHIIVIYYYFLFFYNISSMC